MPFNKKQLEELYYKNDLKVAPYHPDMETTGTPTWVYNVEVDGKIYARSHGIDSSWYQAAIKQKRGKVVINGVAYEVTFEKIIDPDLQTRIDQAYIDKYHYHLKDLHEGTINDTTVRIELRENND